MSAVITSSVFAARYKLACFYIANHLFETVVSIDPEINLEDFKKFQRDSGFFMSSLRLVDQLTAFNSEAEMDILRTKIENSGTMYFKKSILTATAKQGSQFDPNMANAGTADMYGKGGKKPVENLYDSFVVKRLYDSYFSAYVADEPLEFLDKPDPNNGYEDLVSIYELGVFDTDTLNAVSNILDFSTSEGASAALQLLMSKARYDTYKHFFGLVSKYI